MAAPVRAGAGALLVAAWWIRTSLLERAVAERVNRHWTLSLGTPRQSGAPFCRGARARNGCTDGSPTTGRRPGHGDGLQRPFQSVLYSTYSEYRTKALTCFDRYDSQCHVSIQRRRESREAPRLSLPFQACPLWQHLHLPVHDLRLRGLERVATTAATLSSPAVLSFGACAARPSCIAANDHSRRVQPS